MSAAQNQIACVSLGFLNDLQVRIVIKRVTKLAALW